MTSRVERHERGRKCERSCRTLDHYHTRHFGWCIKLHGHVCEEVREDGEGVRLMAQRESPRLMSAIIENNQVILIARNTKYMRGHR
jgi:hypothetical protein